MAKRKNESFFSRMKKAHKLAKKKAGDPNKGLKKKRRYTKTKTSKPKAKKAKPKKKRTYKKRADYNHHADEWDYKKYPKRK